MQQACTAYCLAIKTLIKNHEAPNRAQLAVQAVLDYAGGGNCPTICGWVQAAQQLANFVKQEEQKAGENLFLSNRVYNVNKNMGLAMHAFVLTMYCLLRAGDKPVETFYDYCMYQVVKLQGDTDTNAAIVGGAIGAYVGLDYIDSRKL